MLEIENLAFSYRKKKNDAIKNVSLRIQPGTVCGLLGPNGAGKSTILYLIAGLLRPSSGKVEYNGYIPYERNPKFLEDIFLVPEEYNLPDIKLKRFVNSNSPFYPGFSHTDFNNALQIFELPADIHLGELSMGQKKRVLISFALACNTSLLLLDEPTNGLDIPGKRLFRKALLNGMTDEKSIIISTHQVYDVAKIIDRIIMMASSGIVLDKGVDDIISKLAFSFTNDRERVGNALYAIEAPGGFNIIESRNNYGETELNIESLFEFVRENPGLCRTIFNEHSNECLC